MIKIRDAFESTECSRCLGSGRYSFNLMHGSMCYGCQGKGWKFTKRGRAAYDYFTSLLSKPIRDLQVGDLVRDTYDAKFRRVIEITIREDGKYHVQMNGLGYSGYDGDTVVRVGADAEQKQAAMEKAIAYQGTLTKAGTPRKGA